MEPCPRSSSAWRVREVRGPVPQEAAFPSGQATPLASRRAALAKAGPFAYKTSHHGAWRSMVAHLLWEQGVAGSNPVAPTRITQKDSSTAGVLFFCPSFSPFAALGFLPPSLQAPASRRFPIPAAPLPSPAPPRTHLPLFPLLQGTSRLSSKQSLFRPVAPPMLLGTTRNRRFGICVLI